jgi:hypothetical protein
MAARAQALARSTLDAVATMATSDTRRRGYRCRIAASGQANVPRSSRLCKSQKPERSQYRILIRLLCPLQNTNKWPRSTDRVRAPLS